MGFFKAKQPSFEFRDYWTPEKLKESVGQYGSIYKPEAEDPIYARAADRLRQGISGSYASRGFGALRTGPAAHQEAQGLQEMEENRSATELQRLMEFLKMRQSGATGVVTPGRESGFSKLAGPLLGAVGYGLGGPAGGAIASGFGGLFGGSPGPPSIPQGKPSSFADIISGAGYK